MPQSLGLSFLIYKMGINPEPSSKRVSPSSLAHGLGFQRETCQGSYFRLSGMDSGLMLPALHIFVLWLGQTLSAPKGDLGTETQVGCTQARYESQT